MARLRARFETEAAAAAAIGCSRPLVIAWEKGDAKSIGGKYLLAAARAYRVRPEWLKDGTGPDGFPWGDETSVQSQSQTMQLDQEIVESAHQGLIEMYKKADRVYPMEDVARFVHLYQKLALRKAGASDAELYGVDLSDDINPPQGATSERMAGVPSKGTHKGDVARRVRR
jgi:transcriptional regulator with XRE-family HTH domain